MGTFITVAEIAAKWNISENRVTVLCRENRITNAKKENGRWLIPADADKPIDNRLQQSNQEKRNKAKFTYIDLFAGIGGFHQAMRFLGGVCVMAAEINQACKDTYNLNFDTLEGGVRGDVNDIKPESIEPFDVLCAGFPCQPFSKAGQQQGFNDKTRGNLFYSIMNILDYHNECKFVVLENVRNLADKTENWGIIREELQKRDFIITEKPLILSPSDFGIPQIRERVYILGIKSNSCSEEILRKGFIEEKDLKLAPYKRQCKPGDAFTILEFENVQDYRVTEEQELMINAWDEFRIGTGIKVIGFPIWLNSFGINYKDTEEFYQSIDYYSMPKWKQNYVQKNRSLYIENKSFIDYWIRKYDMTSRIKLYQKFEWNCGEDVEDIHDSIIQIRQSGIRVKRNTYFPSLVAMVNTPIIWDRNFEHYRHITPREAANLQNFNKRYKFSGTDKQIYRQLGNSVNVRVLKIICKSLFELQSQEAING